MFIGTPELNHVRGHVTWSVAVSGLPNTPERLWFRLPEQFGGLATDRADPAIIGLLIPAMHANEFVRVDGPVTDELPFNLTNGYQHIFETVMSGLNRVPLDTPNTVPAGNPAPGIGTGFSAGVDSYAVLAEHHFSPVPEELQITHLTFFNVGSHGSGIEGSRHFRGLNDSLAPIAREIGLPFIPVDSNLDDFYTFGDFQQTCGPRNMSAASLLQGGIGRYYFASSLSYAHTGVHPSPGTGWSDPISMPLLITRQFRPISHGNQYTRVEKTLLIADTPTAQKSLNVCVHPLSDERNCSQCHKCLRTELTLEIAGRLGEFRQVFDLDVYRRHRAAYLDWVVVGDNAYAAEIRDQARQAGFALPSVQMAVLRHGPRVVKRKAISFGRRVRRRLRSHH